MQERQITVPELAIIGATRGMLGAGLGLLLSERLGRDRRMGVGWTLLAIGVLSTIPIAWHVLKRR